VELREAKKDIIGSGQILALLPQMVLGCSRNLLQNNTSSRTQAASTHKPLFMKKKKKGQKMGDMGEENSQGNTKRGRVQKTGSETYKEQSQQLP